MKNISILLILASFLLTVGCKKEKTPPNVIEFLADDLGYGDLACYGNPIIKTPNIDKLADEGVRMTDCHSGGTVCSPSRSALLTGRNPYRSGFFYIHGKNNYLKEEEITIAKEHPKIVKFMQQEMITLWSEMRDEGLATISTN